MNNIKKDNIIFVDFDGPFTNRRCWYAFDQPKKRGYWTTGDPVAIALLNNLCKRFRAKVVLSTTWRKLDNHRHISTPTKLTAAESLRSWGFKGTFHGNLKTPTKNWYRADEIADWLIENQETVNHFCSIDDDLNVKDNGFTNPVVVDGEDGINCKNYTDAIAYLEGRIGFSTVQKALAAYEEYKKEQEKKILEELAFARNDAEQAKLKEGIEHLKKANYPVIS